MKCKRGLVIGVVLLAMSACGPGPAGSSGADGQNGVDGEDATPVTVVKLCPGVTTYPSIFVEIAFCVSGKLYATYSTHGGFSTELAPGIYSSNAVGSKCTFTVAENCVIQNRSE